LKSELNPKCYIIDDFVGGGLDLKKVFVIAGLAMVLVMGGDALAFDAKELAKFKALNKCEGCDLRGANLSRANLSGTDLRADLRGANLTEVDLSGVHSISAHLSGVNLKGANLSGVNLYNAHLDNANLEYANLSGTNLRKADLRGTNLSGADLSKANLKNVKLGNNIFCKTKIPWGVENSDCNEAKF
jgi:hypothetical protein